jgi:membrane AbrB-like protein
MDLIIFYIIAIAGWQVFKKLKVPVSAVLGPIAAMAAANFWGAHLVIPAFVKPVLSTILGAYLGLRFNLSLKGLMKSALLMSAWMILTANLTGFILYKTGIELATAMFAASPGGIAEMGLTAMSFGADTFKVALLQSTRLMSVMFVVPFLVKKVNREQQEAASEEFTPKPETKVKRSEWAAFVLIAGLSSYLMSLTNMAAGNMLGPMIAVGAYVKFKSLDLNPPRYLQIFAQLGIGGLIGLNVTRESILEIPSLWLSALIMDVMLIGSSILLSYTLYKLAKWDLTTCLLATSPAGITPMILLSMELNADTSRVAVLQLVRLVTVVLIMPIQYGLILSG